jgi:hypothetical protein
MAINFPDFGTIDENPANAGYGKVTRIAGGFDFANKKPAEIIKEFLPYFFVIAGLILFVMIVAGGFTIFTSAGNPEKIKQGQGMIINALIGFLVIFAAYWIIQILETTLGFKITA